MWLRIILYGGTLGLIFFLISTLISVIFFKSSIKIYWREFLVTMLLYTLATTLTVGIFYFILQIIEQNHYSKIVSSIVLYIAAPIIYAPLFAWDFIGAPLLHLLFSKKRIIPKYTSIAANYGINAKVILAEKMKNACSTGLLGKSKTIIIGEELIKQMSSDEVKGILCHEIAHQKFNHIWFLLGLQIIYLYIFIILMKIGLLFENQYLGVVIMGAWAGGLRPFLMMLMRPKERQADLFAANAVGEEVFISALNKLNTMNKGRMEKFDFEHPRLSERIAYIRKCCLEK